MKDYSLSLLRELVNVLSSFQSRPSMFEVRVRAWQVFRQVDLAGEEALVDQIHSQSE